MSSTRADSIAKDTQSQQRIERLEAQLEEALLNLVRTEEALHQQQQHNQLLQQLCDAQTKLQQLQEASQ